MVVAIIIRGGRRHSDCRMRRKWPRDEEMNEAESERRKGARTVSVTVFTTRDRRSFVSFSPPPSPPLTLPSYSSLRDSLSIITSGYCTDCLYYPCAICTTELCIPLIFYGISSVCY